MGQSPSQPALWRERGTHGPWSIWLQASEVRLEVAFPAIARLKGTVLLPPDWRYEEDFPQPTPQTLLLCPTTTVLLVSCITRGVRALLASGQAGSTELGEIMGVWKACPMGEKCPSPYQPTLSPRTPAGPGAPFYAEQGLTRVNPMEQRPE